MEITPIMCTVGTFKQGVLIQVLDGPSGKAYQLSMTWDELEAFVKKNGKETTLGQLSKAGSGAMRDMMEMDP